MKPKIPNPNYWSIETLQEIRNALVIMIADIDKRIEYLKRIKK